MTTPAENVVDQFTANGSATYTIAQWIFAKDDITVYFNQGKQDPATYSISVPTSAGYDITFSSPPVAPTLVTILRRIIIEDPADFAPGATLTAEDLNTRFDASYLIELDNEYYTTHIEPTYGDVSLTYAPGSPQLPVTPGDLVLPVLSTPGPTDAPRVWAKDSSGVIIDAPLDPSGKSAAELETELAAATGPTSSGANMIGYWNGSSAVTVQAALDGTAASDLARYTDTTSKIVEANGILADAGSPISASAVELKWLEGSPNPTVSATSNTDTIVATRGYCVGTTPTFTKEATSAAAKAAAAADPNPLHFYWSPVA